MSVWFKPRPLLSVDVVSYRRPRRAHIVRRVALLERRDDERVRGKCDRFNSWKKQNKLWLIAVEVIVKGDGEGEQVLL